MSDHSNHRTPPPPRPAPPPEASDWCILTVTRAGTVSLLTGLAADVAREAAIRLWPRWLRPGGESYCAGDEDGDIKAIHVFRGTGEGMDVWTGTIRMRT